jgi:hypothetical protein
MLCTIPFSSLVTGTNFTFYCVFKFQSNTAGLTVPFRDNGAGGGTALVAYTTDSTDLYRVNTQSVSGTYKQSTELGTTPHAICMLKKGTTVTAYKDGTSRGTATVTDANALGTTMYIARNGSDSAAYAPIDFGELILFNGALSAGQLADMNAFLKGKWGIA